jgi:hypothetical protein
MIAPFLLMQVLYGFSKMIENVGIIRDRAGQLGECGVYWMERRMSGVIRNSKLQGGSPRLCQLRSTSVDPC